MNPFGGGRVTGGNGGRNRQVGRLGLGGGGGASSSTAAPSSSLLQRAPKRQKLDHLETTNSSSKYFHGTAGYRTLRPRPQAGPSTSTSSHRSDPIIIDEDDALDMDDVSPSKRIGSKVSSPDPMDLISSEDVSSYAFDQNKPSPIRQLSSSFEETRRSPKDGESTARLRSLHNATEEQESASRLDREGDSLEQAKPPLTLTLSRGKSTARAEVSPKPGIVRTLVTKYEGGAVPHLNLRPTPSRKSAMKMKPRPVRPCCLVWCSHS
jgi:hypothetical protein